MVDIMNPLVLFAGQEIGQGIRIEGINRFVR